MAEPPTKKHKTSDKSEAGPGGQGAGAGDEVQEPGSLNIELIGRVGSFASTAGRAEKNDLQNILVAVGRREVGVLRHTHLFKNMGYLRRCLIGYLSSPIDNKRVVARRKMRSNILIWIEVNTENWKTLCTKESIKQFAEVRTSGRITAVNPLVIFNNPAVAIELGTLEVLKHFVEEMHVDIGSGKWNCYKCSKKHHLLTLAMTLYSADPVDQWKDCFEYLLTIAGVNVHADVAYNTDDNRSVSLIHDAVSSKWISSGCLGVLVQHQSFDPNLPGHGGFPPLLSAFVVAWFETEVRQSKSEILKKAKILLEARADPTISIAEGQIFGSPTTFLEFTARHFEEGSESHGICVALIALVEEHTRNRE